MPLGIDSSQWLTALLMILTVGVGLLGIFQEHHRKDGKLTRLGWGLIVAICLLGVGTFFSGQRDRRLADEKELADTAERTRQFQSQMTALRRVTGSLSQLQSDMRGSLRTQQQQFGIANQNLRMSATLQQQAQANTQSVLRRVFEESNRVSAERIAISAWFHCSIEEWEDPIPELVSATLELQGASPRILSLSTDQKLGVGNQVIFHGFRGDLGRYESFRAWRDARILIRLRARYEEARTLTVDDAVRQLQRGPSRPAICNVMASLLLNGRQVLNAEGRLTPAPDYGWMAEFDNMRVDQDRLPRYPN